MKVYAAIGTKGFEDIIEFAPKMYKAKLSKEFIQLIDNN
jgi:hypothetical protein